MFLGAGTAAILEVRTDKPVGVVTNADPVVVVRIPIDFAEVDIVVQLVGVRIQLRLQLA
jgi:hypothetical protein